MQNKIQKSPKGTKFNNISKTIMLSFLSILRRFHQAVAFVEVHLDRAFAEALTHEFIYTLNHKKKKFELNKNLSN